MNLVINSYYFIIDDVVSVFVFISTVFMCFFWVNFYCTLKTPFTTCIVSAIKQSEVMVIINMWEFQLWYESATARTCPVTSGPTSPWLLKKNSLIVDLIIGDYVPGYLERLATKFSLVFIPHCFDEIGRTKKVNLFCSGVALIQNVYCFLRYFWRPFEAECSFYKV